MRLENQGMMMDNTPMSPRGYSEEMTPEVKMFDELAYICRKFVMKRPGIPVKELFDQTYELVVNNNFDDRYGRSLEYGSR
jgi:hypothetical protein